MAECNECFICFESKATDATGKLIDLRTGGCGCSHLVHEWCLVKWYMMYGKRRNECPLCKMPGNIHGINELTDKFHDRIPLRAFLVDADGRRRNGVAYRYRAYISILSGLLCIIFIMYVYIYHTVPPRTEQTYYDNITPWDDHIMG